MDIDTAERIKNEEAVVIRWSILEETSADDNGVYWFEGYSVIAPKARNIQELQKAMLKCISLNYGSKTVYIICLIVFTVKMCGR